MRKKNDTLRTNGFDLIRDLSIEEKLIISSTITFLEQNINNTQHEQDIESYNRRITNLINDGGPKNIKNL